MNCVLLSGAGRAAYTWSQNADANSQLQHCQPTILSAAWLPACLPACLPHQAFEVEEQRAKRRRSSSAVGPDFAAAAAAAVAAHTAGGPSATHDPAAAAATATAGAQQPVTPETQATSPPAAAADAAGGSSGGSGTGRAVRRFSKQRSGLVAAVAGATGEASVDDTGALFDPIDAHRWEGGWFWAGAEQGGRVGNLGVALMEVRAGGGCLLTHGQSMGGSRRDRHV